MAKLGGDTVEARVENDYLRFLGTQIADLMYVGGVIPAGHTQNMVGSFSKSWGRLEGLTILDAADLLPLPITRILRGKRVPSELLEPLGLLANEANRRHVDDAFWAGAILGGYVSQAVTYDSDIRRHRSAAKNFIQQFSSRASQVTQITPQFLRDDSQFHWKMLSMELSTMVMFTFDGFASQLASILTDAHDSIVLRKLDILTDGWREVPSAVAAPILKEQMDKALVALVFPQSEEKIFEGLREETLSFSVGNSLSRNGKEMLLYAFASMPEGTLRLGLAYNLTAEQKEALLNADFSRAKPLPVEACSSKVAKTKRKRK